MRYRVNFNQLSAFFNRLELGLIYFDNNLTVSSITIPAARAFELPDAVIETLCSGISSSVYLTARSFTSCPMLYKAVLQVIHTTTPFSFEYIDSHNTIRIVRMIPDLNEQETAEGVYVILSDTIAHNEMNKRILVTQEFIKLLADVVNCGLWEYDPKTLRMSQIRKLDGRYSNENLSVPDYRNSMLSWNLIHPDDVPVFLQYCDSCDNGDAEFEYTLRALSDNDEYIWLQYRGLTLRDSNNEIISVVGRTTDITEEKETVVSPNADSPLDSLTGVLTQNAFYSNIRRNMERGSNNDCHALLLINLDDFSGLNNTFGHLYGDVILESLGEMLQNFCSSSDIVGRISGDEFAVYMKNVQSQDDAALFAERIQKRIGAGIRGQRTTAPLTVSVGIAFYPKHGTDYESLIHSADLALYSAKRAGKNIICSFDDVNQNNINLPMRKRIPRDAWLQRPTSNFIEANIANFALDVFSSGADTKIVIEKIFEEIGKFYDLSRISLMTYSPHQPQDKRVHTDYIWCSDDAEIDAKKLDECTVITYQDFQHLFDERHVYVINDLKKAGLDASVYSVFHAIGTKAMLQYAIFDGTDYCGIINYADTRRPRIWSKHEVDTLITVSRIIGTFILREKSKEELNRNLFFIEALIKSQKLTNYAVDAKTYNLVYFTEYTGTLFPNLRLGQPCYQEIMNSPVPCDSCPIRALKQTGNNSTEFDSYDEENGIWHNTAASKVSTPDGQEIYLISRSNVTNFMEQVHSRDRLTGIATYSRFNTDATALLLGSKKSRRKYALVYFDINRFKYINDEWGYSIGDEILICLAESVTANLEKGELVCRIASDQFCVMVRFVSAEILHQRMQRMNQLMSSTFKTKYSGITVTLSAGVYLFTSDDIGLSSALDKAKLAQETIKASHKNSFAIYNKDLHRKLTKEKELEFQMTSALENKEFYMVLQPKVDAKTGTIVGAEALVRWTHGDSTEYPGDFIPLFERNGFIVELDYYIYDLAFAQLRTWLDEGRKPPVISVNVSRLHLHDTHFIFHLLDLLKKYNVPASYIELELTESLIYDNMERLMLILNELRNIGFAISIDDFGSGFSSLNLIQSLTADIIKLDKAFFLNNQMIGSRRTIVLHIIQLIKGLGMKVVCEGVETKEQAIFLAENKCDVIQGFYYYPPLSIEEFNALKW